MFNAAVSLTEEMYTQNRTKFKQTVCKVFTNVMTVFGRCQDFTDVQRQCVFCSWVMK